MLISHSFRAAKINQRIQCRERLVEEPYLGLHRKRAGYADTLLLADQLAPVESPLSSDDESAAKAASAHSEGPPGNSDPGGLCSYPSQQRYELSNSSESSCTFHPPVEYP